MNNLKHGVERASDSDTSEVAVHLLGTGPPLHATEQKAHELEPLPQILISCHQGFDTCLQPPGHGCRSLKTRYSAGEEGHRLSKNSVYNNVYKPQNRRRSETPSLSTAHGQNDHAASQPCAPIPERTATSAMDLVENESSP
jgi:hypothetical protein